MNDLASRTLRAGSALIASWSASSPPGQGASWFMRPPLAHEALKGEVAYAALGVREAGGGERLLAVVSDLGAMRTVTAVAPPGPGPRLVERLARSLSDLARVAAPLAPGLRGPPHLSAFDGAYALLDALGVGPPGGYFRLTLWGLLPSDASSGASVELGGGDPWPHLVWFTQTEQGVRIDVPDAAACGVAFGRLELASAGELAGALPALAGAVRACLQARASHRARALSPQHAAKLLRDALGGRSRGVARWSVGHQEGSYPRAAEAWVSQHDRLGEHVLARLTEGPAGVEVRIGHDDVRTFADPATFARAVPELADRVGCERERLAPDRLEPGARYRALADFAGVRAGEALRYVGTRAEGGPRDGWTRHEFEAQGEGGGTRLVWLDEGDRESEPVLAALDRYLERSTEGLDAKASRGARPYTFCSLLRPPATVSPG